MCGIAGAVIWDSRYRLTRETLSRMSSRIAHRGPNGEGLFLNHEAEPSPDRPQVGLAHRRLAILDPDPRANQPFTDQNGRWIIFNGEIYNFRLLRAELEKLKPDYAWRTTGDTEVLLVAYDVWGESFLDRLNGMYAFAIWDEPRKSLFLARDRMGQKPLYFAAITRDGQPWHVLSSDRIESDPSTSEVPWKQFVENIGFGAIAFASELPALRPLPWVNWDSDPAQVRAYLSRGYLHPKTIYRGVGQVPPAQCACFISNQIRASIYFTRKYVPAARLADGSRVPFEPVRVTRDLMFKAVERQLVSDVPLGCFLSGGIDSSIVAAVMKQIVGKKQEVLTFSIGFDDPRYDESQYARQVAERLGTRHHEFHVKPDAAEDLLKLAAVFGEPFADSSALPTHYLSRETRKHVKVALSGDGGDELFGGYDRYRAMAIAQRFSALPTPLQKMITARLWQMLPGVHPKSRLTRLKRLLATLAEPAAKRYVGYLAIFDDKTIRSLTGIDTDEIDDEQKQRVETYFHAFHSDVRAALALDRITYLPGDLLTKVDRAAMLHALEVRSPYMDHELVQFAAGLGTEHLLKGGGKRMLREAFAGDLPSWVFKRKKMGFAVPIGQWFRGELRAMLHDHLFAANAFASAHFNRSVIERLVQEHEDQRKDWSQQLYALLMLELWWCGQR